MLTNELTGFALDWAVATAEGWEIKPNTHRFNEELVMLKKGEDSHWFAHYDPSTNWSQGGPIIAREKLSVVCQQGNPEIWSSSCPRAAHYGIGETALIAAMRCFVSSVLGKEVEIPEELK
jgi:hypothetical protein